MERMDPHDEDRLTLRVPVRGLAVLVAVVLHLAAGLLASLIPDERPSQRIQITLSQAPSPTSGAPAPKVEEHQGEQEPEEPPPRPRPKQRRPPPRVPSAPSLPQAPAPVVEEEAPPVEPAPAPEAPPKPAPTWQERLQQQLAATRPRPSRMPAGALAPSHAALERVAAADRSLYDEQTERRLIEDHGAFFRRGLEALRGSWHPDQVLRRTERDPERRCGRQDRTTYAVAILDRQGNVVDVDLKTPSGCPELDDEAVAAFKRVARFPFPPEGIFKAPDGTLLATARYPVRFIVTFDGGLRLDWR